MRWLFELFPARSAAVRSSSNRAFPIVELLLASLVLIAVIAPLSSSQVALNEVYYDHPGADEGFEFVELINLEDTALVLDGYSLAFHDGSGSGWRELWRAGMMDTVPAGGLFVIGGDSLDAPPNATVDLHLQNGPDAVGLLFYGEPRDIVGYGDLSNSSYFEKSSAEDVPAGYSLGRKPDGLDTGDNSADFHRMNPSPGKYNQPRWDLSVSIGGGTPASKLIAPGAVDSIAFYVVNRGRSPTAGLPFVVSVRDSSPVLTMLVREVEEDASLQPGDSLLYSVPVQLQEGYHWIEVAVSFSLDERRGNDTLTVLRRSGSPQVLISEVMSFPLEGCPQYVELYNAGFYTYDLEGSLLGDASHLPSPICEGSFEIGPGRYVVLTEARKKLLDFFPLLSQGRVIQVVGSWPHFNHTGSSGFADSVIVIDHFGLRLEGVSYPPQKSDTRGQSLERLDLYADGGSHSWCISSGRSGGTPGEPARGVLVEPPGKGAVSVHPNPFSPGDGEALLVAIGGFSGGGRAVLSVYDISGFRVKEIGSTAVFPFVFVWDGKGREGSLVTPGVYIVVCEVYSPGGERIGVEKVVVGCGRKRR